MVGPPPTPGGLLATFTNVSSCHSSRGGTNGIKWGETREPSSPHVTSAGGLCCLSRPTSASFPYGRPQQLPSQPWAEKLPGAGSGGARRLLLTGTRLVHLRGMVYVRPYKLPHS